MICQRCNAQYPDHSNFCFHCGLQVNPNMPPQQPMVPFQQFPNQPMQGEVSGDEKIFRLALISFCCIGFWSLIHLIDHFIFRYSLDRYYFFFDIVSIGTTLSTLIFSLAWCKIPARKTLLIIFLVVGALILVVDKLSAGYYFGSF